METSSQQTTPVKKRTSFSAFERSLRKLIFDLLKEHTFLEWPTLRKHLRVKYGRRYRENFRKEKLSNLKTWCKNIGLHVYPKGCSFDEDEYVARIVYNEDERQMTMQELRKYRTEVAIYTACRKVRCGLQKGFSKNVVSLIGDILQKWNAFDSVPDHYETQEIYRSERGLEKADGNLYEVHRAVHLETGREVIIESFWLDNQDVLPTFLERELEMSRILYKHPHLWQIIDEVRTESKVMIVRHNVECTLSSVITRTGAINETVIKNYLRQLFTFVHDCHERGVICDGLSSGSIYVDEDDMLKVTRNPANFYDPPERLIADSEEKRILSHSNKKDIWSLGCVFAKLVLGRWLFRFERTDSSDIDVLLKIFQTLGTPSEQDWPQGNTLHDYYTAFPQFKSVDLKTLAPNLSENGLDLLNRMLCFNPDKRISAHEALCHPYLCAIE